MKRWNCIELLKAWISTEGDLTLKKEMLKRIFGRFFALLLVAAMLTGCGGQSSQEPVDKDPAADADSAIRVEESEQDQPYTNGQVNVRNPQTINWDSEKSIVQTAIDNQTMIIQFMSGEGCYIAGDGSNTTKWGDSTLIVFPNGETMLIDAGMDSYGWFLVENLKKLGVEKLDYIMMSHQHGDHYYGFLAADGIFNNFEIGTFFWTGIYSLTYGTGRFRLRMEQDAELRGIKQVMLARGDEYWFGDVKMTVLSPEQGLVGTYSTDSTDEADNAVSIVARFDYGETSYLTAGDLYVRDEEKLLERVDNELLSVDIAKMNHHGRTTSSCASWCEALDAKIAVATGSIAVENSTYSSYAELGMVPYVDTYDGFVRVEAKNDGTFTVVTSREREHKIFDALDKKYGIERKDEYK